MAKAHAKHVRTLTDRLQALEIHTYLGINLINNLISIDPCLVMPIYMSCTRICGPLRPTHFVANYWSSCRQRETLFK